MTDGPGLEEKFIQNSGKSAAAILASFVIMKIVPAAGMAAGVGACAWAGSMYLNRYEETEGNPSAWPGPRFWPGAMMMLMGLGIIINVESLATLADKGQLF
eukprot:scaffold336_cov384-Prasinococcus_capsulatus_cf.AAC.23